MASLVEASSVTPSVAKTRRANSQLGKRTVDRVESNAKQATDLGIVAKDVHQAALRGYLSSLDGGEQRTYRFGAKTELKACLQRDRPFFSALPEDDRLLPSILSLADGERDEVEVAEAIVYSGQGKESLTITAIHESVLKCGTAVSPLAIEK